MSEYGASWTRVAGDSWELADPPLRVTMWRAADGTWLMTCRALGIDCAELCVGNARDAMLEAQFVVVRRIRDWSEIAGRWPTTRPA